MKLTLAELLILKQALDRYLDDLAGSIPEKDLLAEELLLLRIVRKIKRLEEVEG